MPMVNCEAAIADCECPLEAKGLRNSSPAHYVMRAESLVVAVELKVVRLNNFVYRRSYLSCFEYLSYNSTTLSHGDVREGQEHAARTTFTPEHL